MSAAGKYYKAAISRQNETWQLMNKRAYFHFVRKFDQHPRGRAMAKKCAGVYTRCYNYILSGNYETELENLRISGAVACVEDCARYRKLKMTRKEIALVSHFLFVSSRFGRRKK